MNADDLEPIFVAHYARMARLIARIIRDPGRAEELAVEVFLKYSPTTVAAGMTVEGWLYRTSARMALDELRSRTRRSRYEPLLRLAGKAATPEEIHTANQEQSRVRAVLGSMSPRQAELLLLRSEGLRYEELAAVLELNPASVGTLLSRAQRAFRKEYEERYGTESY
ncbi:MAG: sigma-70 family RNA polymerase sigma factor [Bryobacteraceae bacterium]